MKSILLILSYFILIFFVHSCSIEPINFETDLVKRGNTFYQKNQANSFSGQVFSVHKNQRKKINGYLRDGKKDNLWIEWYSNGSIKSEEIYDMGKPTGEWKFWYNNGNIKLCTNYKNGYLDGLRTEWYENGQKKEIGNYKKNKFHGEWKKWYSNGRCTCIFWDRKTF